MSAPAVETDTITKRFGSFTAVDSLSFQAFDGEVLAILGPNGAGKTTLLKMILGLLRPSSGRILIRGREISRRFGGPRPAIGYMSQRFGLYPLLTGLENIAFAAGISGLSRTAVRAKIGQARARIPEAVLRQKAMDIPSGLRQQIALLACLMADPGIVILDEPTSGAGPLLRRDFRTDISALKADGRAVILTTHELEDAANADRLIILDRGRVAVATRPAEILRSAEGRTMETVYLEALSDGTRP